MSAWKKHEIFEKNSIILVIGILVAISVGGLVEIAPLFYLKSTIEKTEGMRPYTPLELAGREIYIREGCYTCHSQMIRPMRDELERYGHFSLAAESMYDHPFQWGSKRTGPDLARVGGKYSDDWHVEHLIDPRSLVPASIMPGYPFLAETELFTRDIQGHVSANMVVGVPYTDAQLEFAVADAIGQASPDTDGAYDFEERWPNSAVRDFDGNPRKVTEMDALVAYLQVLGTMVDFSIYDNKANLR
ncbi:MULTISPECIES: cytochrome-c oxidase, cbb3-type subunit II [unclassified Roseibium]|jgi:cytochrome c oxidase cbb3-type subunit 2|uniref:cytochrome-c oxidase, cbb3-type subunit II n=1 Tax=unclassified Roseibium TaxID=2629323 RepID=UPI00092CD02C|nr:MULTISPECIES: cytochrome-c oxidase, cbb3-type subunit II [unclassified Roseibium]OJJ13462.1 cytochrome-c oxidase, cbb3-type subunit II [Alphaproteobacteria bacterium AO1-B]